MAAPSGKRSRIDTSSTTSGLVSPRTLTSAVIGRRTGNQGAPVRIKRCSLPLQPSGSKIQEDDVNITREVISIRPINDDTEFAVTVRRRWTPSWWERLLGHKAGHADDVYVGNIIFYEMPSGDRQPYWMNKWLHDEIAGREAAARYHASLPQKQRKASRWDDMPV